MMPTLTPSTCKALTIWQPWAHIISIGLKPVENRTWPVSYRGPILIHAGKTWDTEFRQSGDSIPDPNPGDPISITNLGEVTKTFRTRRHTVDRGAVYDLRTTPFASVLAVGELTNCHPDTGSCCGPYAIRDAYHWLIHNVMPLATPIPTRGYVGLWKPSPQLCEQINADSALNPTRTTSP